MPPCARADDLRRSRASGRNSCVQCRARRVRGIAARRACVPIGSAIDDPPHRSGRHRSASAEIRSSTGKIAGADFVSRVAEAAQLHIFSAAAFGRSRYPCVARRHDWPRRRRAVPGQCRRSLCRKSLQRSVLSVQRSQKFTPCSGHESLCRSVSCAELPSRQPGANRKLSLRSTRRKIASQRSRLQDTVRACSPFVPYARRSLGAKKDDVVPGRGWRTFALSGGEAAGPDRMAESEHDGRVKTRRAARTSARWMRPSRGVVSRYPSQARRPRDAGAGRMSD